MQDALYIALESGLRLLHPFMPFVTEELWQRLPRTPGLTEGIESIMLAPYPVVVPGWTDAGALVDLELANTIVKAVRSLRAAYGLVRATQLLRAYATEVRAHPHASRCSFPRLALLCLCTCAPTPLPPRCPPACWRCARWPAPSRSRS
jgi:valyl-tRNA synthetase